MKKKFLPAVWSVSAGLFLFVFSNLVVGQSTPITLYAPATPTSIPIILASKNLPDIRVTLFTDHSQASALFIKGDATILVTGLDVGIGFFKNGIPLRMVNSYVSGLSYLVTNGKKATGFADLKGKKLYLPFEGSPIEMIARFFAIKAGLEWRKDIQPVYIPFASSVELLKQGKADAVILPEPFVSQVSTMQGISVSFGLKEYWEQMTGITTGYPQVGTFVKSDWAAKNAEFVQRFNEELKKAIEMIEKKPTEAIHQTASSFKFPEPLLLKALGNTRYRYSSGNQLKTELFQFYGTIGSPLDEKFGALILIN
ncbi:MAG: ABC transporter substrate-binding protein [Chitinivibrionales bacterium]|nr:ABC transporter substrate-binding protein [Chitinivibrionales bacterium]